MKSRILIFFIFLAFGFNESACQNPFVVLSGRIVDSVSGNIIKEPVLSFPEHNRVAEVKKGLFKIALPKGDIVAVCYANDYFISTRKLKLFRDTVIEIKLTPNISTLKIDEVIIKEKSNSKIKENNSGFAVMNEKFFQRVVLVGGERNILMSATSLPGVQSINEGSGAMSIRGSQGTENLYLIDGAPLFSVNSFYGLLSPFDHDDCEKIKLYKGRIPSSYGGRLAGVLTAKVKTDSISQMSLNIGVISNSLKYSTSTLNDKLQWMFKVKRSYLDIIRKVTDPLSNTNSASPLYLSGLSKVSYKLDNRNKISLTCFYDKDIIKMKESYDSSAVISSVSKQNYLFSLSLDSKINFRTENILSGSFSGLKSKYLNTTERPDITEALFEVNSSISYLQLNNIIIKSYEKSELKVGGELSAAISRPFDFGYEASYDMNSQLDTMFVKHVSIFGDLHGDIFNKKLSYDLGIRFSEIFNGNQEIKILPSGEFNYLFNRNSSISAFYGRNLQYLEGLENSGMGFPFEFWTSSNISFDVALSSTFGIAFTSDKVIEGQLYSFYVSAYRKFVNNNKLFTGALYFSDGYTNNFYVLPRPLFANGSSKISGLEGLIEKKSGKTTGSLSYSYIKGTSIYPTINDGKEFLASSDRPYDISLNIHHKINLRWSLSTQWKLMAGKLYTIPQNYYLNPQNSYVFSSGVPVPFNIISVGEKINNFRSIPYHRMDFSMQYKFRLFQKFDSQLDIGIYNVYNRSNPYYYFLEIDYFEEDWFISLKSVSLFPMIPYASLNIKF